MPETIRLPGVGSVQTRYVVIGGLAVAAVAGFFWVRHWSGAGAPVDDETAVADFTTDQEVIYPAYSDAYATDYAYDGPYPYPSHTTPSYGLTTTVQTADPVTNSSWTQRSIEHLELVGVESQSASLAVSRYLLKECLTATQADIVRQAVAAMGPPPQGSFSIVVCPPGGGTAGAGDTPGQTLPAPGGLRILRVFRTEVQVAWNPVVGAKGYAVYRSEPAAATSTWQRQTTSVYNSFQFKGLRPGTSYQFRVETIGADNRPGGAAVISAKTNK